mmetsp:Transcript_39894/g.89389  ORF Transcript_39894/g.89389 Transcript_39894/m.89389 type:complete len:205 (+) Transcript_39894:6571-7185(+)
MALSDSRSLERRKLARRSATWSMRPITASLILHTTALSASDAHRAAAGSKAASLGCPELKDPWKEPLPDSGGARAGTSFRPSMSLTAALSRDSILSKVDWKPKFINPPTMSSRIRRVKVLLFRSEWIRVPLPKSSRNLFPRFRRRKNLVWAGKPRKGSGLPRVGWDWASAKHGSAPSWSSWRGFEGGRMVGKTATSGCQGSTKL